MNELFKKLSFSYYRSGFHLKKKETDYLKEKGMARVKEEAIHFMQDRIAPASPKNEGRQTPMRNHPVFVAQHATATCCRKCVEKWHNIPRGRDLKKSEIALLVECVMHWIDRESTLNVKHNFLR
jgi:exodeoxyribonuclease V alpha subunit